MGICDGALRAKAFCHEKSPSMRGFGLELALYLAAAPMSARYSRACSWAMRVKRPEKTR
jgi:hypothetical protein